MASRHRFIFILLALLTVGLLAIACLYWRVSTEPSRHDYPVEYQVNHNPRGTPATQQTGPAPTDDQVLGKWFGTEQRMPGVAVYWSSEPDNKLLFTATGRHYELSLERGDRPYYTSNGYLFVVRAGMLLEFDWEYGQLRQLPERDDDFGLVGKNIFDIRSDNAWIVYYGCDADLLAPTDCHVHTYDRAAGRVTASMPITIDLYESAQIVSWNDSTHTIVFRSVYGEGPSVGGSLFRFDMRKGTRVTDWSVEGDLTCKPDPMNPLSACDRKRTTDALVSEAWFQGMKALDERQRAEDQQCAKDIGGNISAKWSLLGCSPKSR